MIDKLPSCEDPGDPDLLPVDIASQRIRQMLPVPDASRAESLSLDDALGRILAADIHSPIDVPSYTNSAMDGYAIAATDIPSTQQNVATLQVVGTAWAGRPYNGDIARGQAVRIMTGAMMPAGLDTVVIQEHVATDESNNTVTIDADVQPGRNVRLSGEDVTRGQSVFTAGTRLTAAHLGVLASIGIDKVQAHRQITVAFFTTGDELRSLEQHAGETLGAGELFDSNRYTLTAMLKRLGVRIIYLGIVPDDAESTRQTFTQAASRADIIVTSGGVSAGEADYVTQVIHEMGEVGFWKLAMRPGRPLAFGRVGEAFFFGLPGNPVAVMVTFYEFVQSAILQMMGASDCEVQLVTARSVSALKKSPGRTEYQRGVLSLDENGHSVVNTTGKQGAGRLTSMCEANCLIVLPPGSSNVAAGDLVTVRPFYGLM